MLEAQRVVSSWIRSRESPKAAPPDLLSAASHELRTPLTTLLVQAQEIERRLIADPAWSPDPAAVHRIASEARRLRRLIEELLDAAAVESGRLVLELEPVDLADLARQAAASSAAGRAVVEAAVPVIGRYDRRRIRLLLEEIVGNAERYGTGAEPIRILVWQQDQVAYIAVQDRGMGIPPEDLPRVFERLHRGANAADLSVPGLGLGLYLAKAIAQAHRGAIAIHSTPLEGTTVTVALPLDPEQDAGHAAR